MIILGINYQSIHRMRKWNYTFKDPSFLKYKFYSFDSSVVAPSLDQCQPPKCLASNGDPPRKMKNSVRWVIGLTLVSISIEYVYSQPLKKFTYLISDIRLSYIDIRLAILIQLE